MEKIEYDFIESKPSGEEYLKMRKKVGWSPLCEAQVNGLIDNTDYFVLCKIEDQVIGMARIFWDRGYIAYISDVMVDPQFQGIGIGSRLVEHCLNFVDENLKDNWRIKVVGEATKGNESFYQKLGFRIRPNESTGCGFDCWRKIGEDLIDYGS